MSEYTQELKYGFNGSPIFAIGVALCQYFEESHTFHNSEAQEDHQENTFVGISFLKDQRQILSIWSLEDFEHELISLGLTESDKQRIEILHVAKQS